MSIKLKTAWIEAKTHGDFIEFCLGDMASFVNMKVITK